MQFLILFSLFTVNLYAQNYAYKPNYSQPDFYEEFYTQETEVISYQLSPKYEKIVTDLAYLQVLAIGTIGVIALLPESISQWSEEDKALRDTQTLLKKHADHLEEAPKMDNDNFAINYIGHPVSGSYFYIWGRQSGLSRTESFVLTTLMSTFYWEYGWEAFAEVPSTQDLLITPILGSLLGEVTNHLYNEIVYQENKVYDSLFLGSLSKILLNPIGQTNEYLREVFDTANIEITVDYSYAENIDKYQLDTQSYFNLNFTLKY